MKILNILGVVLSLITIVISEPTCKYSIIDTKYVCLMENAIAEGSSTIGGTHISGKSDADVYRVTTIDEADSKLLTDVQAKFTKLEILQIQKGKISALNSNLFENCTLKQIQLWNGDLTSPIRDSPFEHCTLLEELDLNGNFIKSLSISMFSYIKEKIKKLVLSNNQIDVLWDVSNIFNGPRNFPSLLHLNLSGNSIVSVSTNFTFPSAVLTQFDISNNLLTEFPEALLDTKTLETLNLNINKLTAISGTLFKKATALKELKLGSNNINTIDETAFSSNTNLQSLDISSNPITMLNANLLKGITTLKSLDLHDIKINSSSFEPLKIVLDALTNLEALNISSNNIGSIDGIFSKNVNLVNLSINSMELDKLSSGIFSTLTKLEHLSFDQNKITEIPANIFDKTTAMKTISAQGNKISSLKASTFEKMTNLAVLDLSRNEINSIERTFFDNLKNLKVVKFSGENKCINEDFNEFVYNNVTQEKLQNCFNNYNGAQAIIISNLLLAFVIVLKFI